MAKLLKKFFSKAAKKNKLEQAMGTDENQSLTSDLWNTFQGIFPQVQPKRWMGFDAVRDDAKMLKHLFLRSINYFKYAPNTDEKVEYDSRDDYLRRQKLTPTQLKNQLKRFTVYSIICYILALAIAIYTGYIIVHVSILDGVICSFFALFVLAKGLQFNLFIRQIKAGNFKIKLQELFRDSHSRRKAQR